MTRMLAVLTLCVVAVASSAGAAPQTGKPAGAPVRVSVETSLGAFEVELDPRAPITVANFLAYVDARLFDGGRFHRTVRPDNQRDKKVPIDVIQGGPDEKRKLDYPPAIALERTNATGILHKDGTISMARVAGEPDSARGDFFICVGDQPSLDFDGARNPDGQGFAAFGRVVSGMDVVRRIHMAPAKGETLTPPVTIVRVRRLS